MNTFLPSCTQRRSPNRIPSRLAAVVAVVLVSFSASASAEESNDRLSDSDILTTVRINQPVVRQRCWEPRKATVGTTSVRAAIKVTPDGRVETVEASGDSDAMVDCVSRQIRTWRFPASKKSSTVQVPFKFVMQR